MNQIEVKELYGGMARAEGPDHFGQTQWFECPGTGGGITFSLESGGLAGVKWLASDMLLDGEYLAVFSLNIREPEQETGFRMTFGLVNQCSARMRMPLEMLNQGQWRYDREAAWLKPLCSGERVDPAKADTITLTVIRTGERPVRFCMTPLAPADTEPEKLEELILPKGKLLDEMGQSTIHSWQGKTEDTEELKKRLKQQKHDSEKTEWPDSFSPWGGDAASKAEGTGYFATFHDGKRWWLTDPDGHLFWSAGMDCVRSVIDFKYEGLEDALTWMPDMKGKYAEAWPEAKGRRSLNYLAANFIRTFGEKWYESWAAVALSELKRTGFNTVANWSEWEIAKDASFPYVRPMNPSFSNTPMVYRDFPDVFHEGFEEDAAVFAGTLEQTAEDPSLIGYFMMNEPTWGFASECPAAGMLYTSAENKCRGKLVRFLKEKYTDDSGLAEAWNMNVSFSAVHHGLWKCKLSDSAVADLESFSEIMVDRFFGILNDACRNADPHHLNLGIRYYTVPPWWAVKGMKCFDVFSMNCYRDRIPGGEVSEIAQKLNMPVMIGEWHFGALDAGLPASGIGHVRTQQDRGKAYRVYLEDAAAHPACVGVHYFTLYDQSALGRFDGENYQIGFLDICNRPYEKLCEAALESHSRMYEVASGREKPYNDPPEYLERLFN